MLTYNREKLVGRAIESILGQTYWDFEFVIVDNGSTDESGRIADQYAEQDNRIRVIHCGRKNIGVGRNIGLDHAKGEYITFIDDDDWVESDYLAFLYSMLIQDRADVAICGAADKAFEEKRVMTAEESLSELFWRKRYNVAFPAKLFKASLFEGQRFSETAVYDDIELMPRILGRADRVVYHGLPKYTSERHENNHSAWTTNHSMLDANTLKEYLAVYRSRTRWLIERFPQSAVKWRYFEWSFMLSMLEKITRLTLTDCYAIANQLRHELVEHKREFVNSGLLSEVEKQWMTAYL